MSAPTVRERLREALEGMRARRERAFRYYPPTADPMYCSSRMEMDPWISACEASVATLDEIAAAIEPRNKYADLSLAQLSMRQAEILDFVRRLL